MGELFNTTVLGREDKRREEERKRKLSERERKTSERERRESESNKGITWVPLTLTL